MGLLTENFKDNKVYNTYDSTNIKSSIYDEEKKELIIEFKGGRKYMFEKVPLNIYGSFKRAKSQGSYFNKNIRNIFGNKIIT